MTKDNRRTLPDLERERVETQAALEIAINTGDTEAPVRDLSKRVRELDGAIDDARAAHEVTLNAEAIQLRELAREEYDQCIAKIPAIHKRAKRLGDSLLDQIRDVNKTLQKLDDLTAEFYANRVSASDSASRADITPDNTQAYPDGATEIPGRFLRDLRVFMRGINGVASTLGLKTV